MPKIPFLLALVVLSQGALLLGQAPSGYLTWVDKEIGMSVYAPKAYSETPQEPTEVVIRGAWLRRDVPKELKRTAPDFKPMITLFLFRKGPSGGVTGTTGETAAPSDEPKSLRDLMEKQGQVKSLDELMQKKLPRWDRQPVAGEENQWHLTLKGGDAPFRGILILKEERGYVYGLYGITHADALTLLRKEMAGMYRGLKLPSESKAGALAEAAEAEIMKLYRGKSYRAIEHRVKVRKSLAQGWRAEDTENYIIVYKTRNDALIRRIARDVEAMRALYAEAFPPVKPIEAVNIIRILPNLVEYHHYGGPPNSGGFWHPGNEELVLFDYDQERKDAAREKRDSFVRELGNRDSMLVLKHEAFHQWIYYAVGEISPHYWFNEGHGDYYSGAVTSNQSAKILRVDPSSWRYLRAREQAEGGQGKIELKELLRAERGLYYGQKVSYFYAAGWSFVYFMRTSEEVRSHPQWSQLLDLYFNTLKTAYTEELSRFGESPSLGDQQRAAVTARQRAIDKALEGVDLDALQKAWDEFIKTVKSPI